ncbi:hypothetical protein [Ruminococcus sp. XPD3002]|uniref:hypothetical protein n=1 Tax=Ruminococcus sp. XPD3002 TaxID=1452269 RepID=UPI00090FD4E3|nr:hypothetical protein SAMN04487832_101273 [Ruminococcus flavefaciens]
MNKVKIIETMSLLDDELIGEASVNADTADETVGENISVTGVEAYRPNKWRRFALIAASFLLIAGVGAGGKLMIDNRAPMLPDDTPTMPFATEAATEPRTAEETEAVHTEKPSSAAVAVKTEKAAVQTASATVAVTEPEKETQPDEKAEEEVIEQTTVGDITEETEQIPSTTNDLVLREIVPKPTESQMIIQSDETPTQPIVSQPDEFANFDIFNSLAGLSYAPYTCDGLPEYVLNAPDGTIYWLNLSSGWVWRRTPDMGAFEEHHEGYMTQTQIDYLKQHGTEVGMYPTVWN